MKIQYIYFGSCFTRRANPGHPSIRRHIVVSLLVRISGKRLQAAVREKSPRSFPAVEIAGGRLELNINIYPEQRWYLVKGFV